MTASAPRATQPPVNHVTRSFTPLATTVRDMGLLNRAYGFYAIYAAAIAVALGGVITGFILLGDSWFQLLIAGALAVVLTQIAFLGHEASHRAILVSGPANDRVGRFLSTVLVGISHQW